MSDRQPAAPEPGSSGEFAAALATLARLSKGANYRVIQEDTAKRLARCLAGLPPAQAALLLCDSVAALLDAPPAAAEAPPAGAAVPPPAGPPAPAPAPAADDDGAREGAASCMAAHLLLDALPELCRGPPGGLPDTAVQRRTAALFASCLAPARLRMAPKVAAGFGLTPACLHATGALRHLPPAARAGAAHALLADPPPCDAADAGARPVAPAPAPAAGPRVRGSRRASGLSPARAAQAPKGAWRASSVRSRRTWRSCCASGRPRRRRWRCSGCGRASRPRSSTSAPRCARWPTTGTCAWRASGRTRWAPDCRRAPQARAGACCRAQQDAAERRTAARLVRGSRQARASHARAARARARP